MRFDFTGRNYEVGERLKTITEQKLSKLDKYFTDGETKAKVCFKKQGQTLTVEIMLDYLGKLVRATASGDNFYSDLDLVLPRLEGQIRKHRTKFDKHSKNVAFKEISLFDRTDDEEREKSSVVKEKKFVLSPMTVNEAMEEMELLGHSFYVFKEVKTGSVQVLYKRNDGDLGLIVPEV